MEVQNSRNTPQRKRSDNWLAEDKLLLQELIKARVAVLEDKNTDTNTNKKKQAAWTDLLHSFNGMCKGSLRSIPQLRSQWGVIKINTKKEKAAQRREMSRTGGGPQTTISTVSADDISAWLPNEFVIDSNEFDCDRVHDEHKMNKKPVPAVKPLYESQDSDDPEQIVQRDVSCEVPSTSQPHAIHVQPHAIHVSTTCPPRVDDIPRENDGTIDITEAKKKSILAKKKRQLERQANFSSIACHNVEAITKLEIECKKEIHKLKLRNINKKFEVLEEKLLYYKRKNLELGVGPQAKDA